MATEKVMVTVKMLVAESGVAGKKIRRKLRKAKMGVGFGKSYEWPEGGADIKRVRELLGIKPEAEAEEGKAKAA